MSHVPIRRRVRISLVAGPCLVALLCTGCVERRYTVRTDPPGALVIVNDEEMASPSPASSSFAFYGDRKITVLAEGYEPLHVIQPIKAPWYDNVITEFFTENLLPVTLRDEREFFYKLTPVAAADPGDLVNKAENLRAEAATTPPPKRGGLLGFFGF